MVASVTGYTPTWISKIVWRYNDHGVAGLGDRRQETRARTLCWTTPSRKGCVPRLPSRHPIGACGPGARSPNG
jgi:hypothetical protein